MPIIDPPEFLTVGTTELAIVVQNIQAADHFGWVPLRREATNAARRLLAPLRKPLLLGQPVTDVPAEDVWWVTQAAEELGNARNRPATGSLFRAVDHLLYALGQQAPRTDYGLTALGEAEAVLDALTGEDTDR